MENNGKPDIPDPVELAPMDPDYNSSSLHTADSDTSNDNVEKIMVLLTHSKGRLFVALFTLKRNPFQAFSGCLIFLCLNLLRTRKWYFKMT